MTKAQPSQHTHKVRLRPPFFQKSMEAALLRYLDPDFIARFQQDVLKQRFEQVQFSAWVKEENSSQFDNKPVLRLPTHRTFHLICCEVICERFGLPALDPAHITSSGFVIRRLRNDEEQAWMMEEGEPIGWRPVTGDVKDPDLDRRICANGMLSPPSNHLTYSGEQIHPLHILTSRDDKDKRHTLLYGYVPLGGTYYERDADTLFDEKSQQESATIAARSLPWPFGYRGGKGHEWTTENSLQVEDGVPTKEIFELLRLLVNRYHLGEEGIDLNAELEELFSQIWFYDDRALPKQFRGNFSNIRDIEELKAGRKFHLTKYLRDCFARGQENPLVQWIIEQEDAADKAGGLDKLVALPALPQSKGDGTLDFSLKLTASDAEDIRHHLGQRYREQTIAQAREIPLPKFGQEEQDIFQIVPFVRFKNDQGQEQIQWGEQESRSLQFRVASPFDPEASRPSLIPMPSLRDLKRGLAKGASVLTPGDTFDLINGLNLKKGASEDVIGKGPKLGIQWICSFSLPVITLVAMILLMIMISLLNIVFFWLPWVRICIPFPKSNK
ncbi:MAG: hypothetical protein QNJ17_00500 [Desulfocapsaceae bacterium]|nr:hypothetical protein [Desulfocapsaceae bacterium]